MLQRYIFPKIQSHLEKHPILLLLGSKGVKKHEMICSAIQDQEELLHIDFSKKKNRTHFESVGKEASYLPLFKEKKYIVLQEAQYLVCLQRIIEEVLTKNYPIRLILLCSYEPILDKVLRDVLIMEGLEMKVYPYLFQEMAQHQGVIEFDKHLETRLVYGNYPEVLSHPAQAEKYLLELVKTSIFTNLNPNERINKGDKLLKMVQLLAFEMGEPISYYDIGQRCGLDNETVERYIELLEKAFLLKKVPSFFNDKKYELKKTHVVFFLDNGFRNAVIQNFNPLDLRNDVAALWKNWLIAERIKWNEFNGIKRNYYFWRTHTKQQMDFIEEENGKIAAYKSLWDKRKKPKFPASFQSYYPEAGLFALNRSTYWGFLSKK